MPARRKPKMRIRADYFRPHLEEQQQARRRMCSWLKFWKACGHKKCLRAQACAAANDCFDRLWPLVPEDLKIGIRATIKARHAGLSPAETAAAIERDLALWRATAAPKEVPQAAEPAPQSLPIVPTPNPRAPSARATGPRLRVL